MLRCRVKGLLLRSIICYKLLIRRGFIVKPPSPVLTNNLVLITLAFDSEIGDSIQLMQVYDSV
jgi:hypothetical protein